MLAEFREYTAAPGKLSALVRRFDDHTLDLFREHGIDIVPQWQQVKRDSERDGPLVTQARRRLLTTRPFDSSS